MEQFFDVIDKYVMEPMSKAARLQFVRAIMAAGMATIPFTIVGSAFLILNIVPQAFPVLNRTWQTFVYPFTNLYMIGNYFTMGILALYFNLIMGYELTNIKAQAYDLPLNPVVGSQLGMMAFLFTLTELSIRQGMIVYKSGTGYINGINYGNFATRLGSSGIFTGILMATLAVAIYKNCVQKGICIKLPGGIIPDGVVRAFLAILPCFFVAFAVIIINGLLLLIGYDLFTIISVPFSFVAQIADTWYGVFIVNLLITLLWSVGIHGATIIGSFTSPIVYANLENNQRVLETNMGRYRAFAGQFQNMYVTIGGSGATLGVTIWMAFLARSEQLSILGKAAIGPALFNINEPIIFGMPIIYNPNVLIPFIFAQPICALIVYILISSNMFPAVITEVPWPTPAGLGGFVGTASLAGAIPAFITIVVSTLIYYPFIKKYDRALYAEEERTLAKLDAMEAAEAAGN